MKKSLPGDQNDIYIYFKDQNDFANIPEIGKTMQLFGELVSELKATSKIMVPD